MSNQRKKYKVGDIYRVNLGDVDSNEVRGHEQGKVRPCIIVSALTSLKLAIIIPLTSKKPKIPSYCYVEIEKSTSNKLAYDSNALCHQIRVIATDRMLEKIGKLSSIDLDKIKVVLADLLEIE